ncbi:MAG: hypothetical protein JNK15_25870 [Planctomycetes bacterium]|nr:hypothetical protein [Planctomycetota bacterium]
MDVGAFVQENKRWLLGVAIGSVVWLVASSVVGSMFKVTNPTVKSSDKVWPAAARDAARDEHEKLVAERQKLQQELGFVPTPKFQLANNGRPDEYQFQLSGDLKKAIVAAAQRRDVQAGDTALQWELPAAIDDIRATVFGLELVDELQQRLFAAHDATRAADENAIGLRAILSLKLDARRGQRPQARAARAGEVDLRDFLVQEPVSFQFQADEPTVTAFLESLRRPGRTLVLDSVLVQKPVRAGEPCTVKGVVQGIAWKEGKA